MKKTSIVCSPKSWIEGEAVRQLEQTATLPGMLRVVGMPDLHPGKGSPIGASFISQDIFYPHLVGNDIGCGIGLWMSDIRSKKVKRDKWVKKLVGLDDPWDGDTQALLDEAKVTTTEHDRSLGTIGGGNHFAELQVIDKMYDSVAFEALGMRKDRAYLAVHSGSRGLGHAILTSHLEQHHVEGLVSDTPDAQQYLAKHNHALQWAGLNRKLIAQRIFARVGGDGQKIVDLFHNTLTPLHHQGQSYWLHRKGAAPADQGAALIPGSRGSLSYLVKPIRQDLECGYSLAHGAGRKWKRSEAKGKLQNKYRAKDLLLTSLGSAVICENKELLYQEAPQAYKNVEQVMQDMIDHQMIEIIASFKPVITYKTRVRR